ncbi:MAG: hypothetical protein ABEJ36_03000 [Candidatus Nanosalina sp.]
MVHEAGSESLEEAFRKHKNNSYRPHMGPSGMEFEKYKGGGQSRDKPSHSEPAHELGTSQSLEDTYSSGVLEGLKAAVFGSEDPSLDDYRDLAKEVDGEHGSIDPSEHNVPEVQDWIDEQLEEGDYQMVGKVLAAEELGDQRVGVLDYVEESDLREYDPEKEAEEAEFFDVNDKSALEP